MCHVTITGHIRHGGAAAGRPSGCARRYLLRWVRRLPGRAPSHARNLLWLQVKEFVHLKKTSK